MTHRDWIAQAVLFLVGIAFVIESLRLGLGSPHSPRSGFLPFFVALALSLLALVSIMTSVVREKKTQSGTGLSNRFRSVALVVAGLFIYVVSLPWLGYLLGTFLVLVFLFRVGGIRNYGVVLLAAVVTTSTSFFIFDWCLNLRFPRGILGF